MAAGKRTEIIFQRIGWDENVARHVLKAPHTDPTIDPIRHFKTAVEAKKMIVLGAFARGQHIGSLICGVYAAECGSELVMHVVGGDVPKYDLTAKGLAAAELVARESACKVVRFETCRPGIVAKAGKQGFQADAMVMRKVLNA